MTPCAPSKSSGIFFGLAVTKTTMVSGHCFWMALLTCRPVLPRASCMSTSATSGALSVGSAITSCSDDATAST